MTPISFPVWTPCVEPGSRILIVGASGGIGRALVDMLFRGPECTIGAHRNMTPVPVAESDHQGHAVIDLQRELVSEDDCVGLVNDFIAQGDGIDGLVVLTGFLGKGEHWKDLSAQEWEQSVHHNLNIPFYLARAAMQAMTSGTILLTGTESALHGGSPASFPYGVSKRGTECLVQGLAREGAAKRVTVNGVRMGYIKSGAHERRLGKTDEDMQRRAEMVLLRRGGRTRRGCGSDYVSSFWLGTVHYWSDDPADRRRLVVNDRTEAAPFAIIGAGGHARVLIALLHGRGIPVVGVFDENATPAETILGVPLLASPEKLHDFQGQFVHLALAIGDNHKRKIVYNQLSAEGFSMPALQHAQSFKDIGATQAPASLVCNGAILGAEAHLETGAILNSGAILDHESRLGSFSHLAPGVRVGGRTLIGDNVFVGMGAVIANAVTVGNNVVIGANSVVLSDVPDDLRVSGVFKCSH